MTNPHNITSINSWADTETFSVIEVVVARDLDSTIDVADEIYRRLVGFDESVDVKVQGVDRAVYLYERNQEVALWR